jgi:acetamidase/formamidase
MTEHRIGREVRTHRRWDVDIEPVLVVAPGDVVTAETDDFAGGQITRSSTAADLPTLDFDRIYPLAGPV